MIDNSENRKCAGNAQHCETFEMFFTFFESSLVEGGSNGTELDKISPAVLEAWKLVEESADMSEEDKQLVRAEFRRAVFEEEFKPEEHCPSVDVLDSELPSLNQRYPRGYSDCALLSDRIGRVSLVDLG